MVDQGLDETDVLTRMFGGRYKTSEARDRALVTYKDAVDKALGEHDRDELTWNRPRGDNLGSGQLRKGFQSPEFVKTRLAGLTTTLEKSVGGGDSASAAILADLQDFSTRYVESLEKDWSPTNPVGGTGLTPYDLEEQAKVLVPLHTPIVNSTPREKGQGNARKFKRIDSFSNAGIPGGAGQLSPFFSSLTTTSTWGPTGNVTLARPGKISYTGSDWTVSYVELGMSDSVDFISQFEGLGFDDVRGLSHTALLYAHKMGEERGALYGRGATGGGYSGTVAAPGTPTTTTATTGGSIPANSTYFIYVTANTGFGESVASTVSAAQATTGAASTITVTVNAEPVGAVNYNVYMGTTTGVANSHFQGTFAGNVFTLTTYNSTATAQAPTVDTSFSANSYDGYLAIQSNPALTGYFRRYNQVLSTTNPGDLFDIALAAMYVNNGADPDEIWMDGAARASLQRSLRIGGTSGAASGYRTNITMANGNTVIGSSVTGIMNANTGKILDVMTHRFMPIGAALIRSTSLPIENSRVTSPVSFVNVQDYMAIDWPTIQLTYDQSTYQIGSMLHRAPAWSGAIFGIQT